MKKLIEYDHHTHKPKVVATFTLEDGEVTVEPASALNTHHMLKKLVAKGNKQVEPKDGQAYYDALSRLRGTFYEVVDSDKAPKPTKEEKAEKSESKKD